MPPVDWRVQANAPSSPIISDTSSDAPGAVQYLSGPQSSEGSPRSFLSSLDKNDLSFAHPQTPPNASSLLNFQTPDVRPDPQRHLKRPASSTQFAEAFARRHRFKPEKKNELMDIASMPDQDKMIWMAGQILLLQDMRASASASNWEIPKSLDIAIHKLVLQTLLNPSLRSYLDEPTDMVSHNLEKNPNYGFTPPTDPALASSQWSIVKSRIGKVATTYRHNIKDIIRETILARFPLDSPSEEPSSSDNGKHAKQKNRKTVHKSGIGACNIHRLCRHLAAINPKATIVLSLELLARVAFLRNEFTLEFDTSAWKHIDEQLEEMRTTLDANGRDRTFKRILQADEKTYGSINAKQVAKEAADALALSAGNPVDN